MLSLFSQVTGQKLPLLHRNCRRQLPPRSALPDRTAQRPPPIRRAFKVAHKWRIAFAFWHKARPGVQKTATELTFLCRAGLQRFGERFDELSLAQRRSAIFVANQTRDGFELRNRRWEGWLF